MAATDTAPNLTNNPALVRALVALLISQPERPTIAIAAAGQEYTRAACRRAIAEALRAYARQVPALVNRHPNLADFTKYPNETSLLEDAWLIVNEFVSAQLPERNLPTREQLEYWMNQQELDRLERLAANPNPASPWRAETLTLEQMQLLIARARAWDEARLNIQEATTNALVNDLPPRIQALAIESQDIRTLTDIPASAATQAIAADLQTSARFDPSDAQAITGILGRSSHPASAATTVATASAAGRSIFRQGVTEALQAPLSFEAASLSHSLRTAGFGRESTRQILNRFEDAVGQGRDHATALRTALTGARVSPKEAERIVSATSTSAQEYHRLVKEVGPQVEQLRQAVATRQQFARAATPSARQLVTQIQRATGVGLEKATQARQQFEAGLSRGLSQNQALDQALTDLSLSPGRTQVARAVLAQAATTYQAAIEQGRGQTAAQQFTQKIREATGVDPVEATKILSALEQKVAQNQPHQTAVAESLTGKLAEPETPETFQKAYAALAPAVEDYAATSRDVRAQPVSAAVARPVAEQFTQEIQAAAGANPEQANQVRLAFEEALKQGKTAETALTESLNALPLSPEQTQQATKKLQGPADLYQPFVQQDKTQMAVAQASPIAQVQFVQRLASSANLSRLQAVQISLLFEQAIRLGQDPATALRSSLADPSLGLAPDQLEQLSTSLTPFAQEYATLLQAAPVAQAGLAPSPTSMIPLTTIHALNEQSLPDGKIITYTALELHQWGVRNDTLARQLAQSPHQTEFNPELIQQTQEALGWLEQHPELLQEFGLATPTSLEHFALEMDSRPRGSTEYFRRRFELLNQQLNSRNAQGLSGWLKAPGLKWQTSWAKFAADHAKLVGFAGFISSPKTFVTNKVGGWLAGKGLRLLGKSATGKAIGGLLTKIGSKLAGKGLAKLLGGAIGSLGGPIGTVVGIALGFVLEKAGGWLLKNLKKIAAALGAFLALLIGLMAKLAATLPALLTGLGVWLTPAVPIIGVPMLITGLAGLAHQLGAWLGKGGIPNLLSNLGSSIGNFLGLSTTATVPAYVMAAPFVAIGGLAVISVFSTMALTSAFVLPPTEAQLPGLSGEAGNIVEFTCDHPACKIADIVQAYAGGVLTQNTWTASVDNLLRANLSAAAVEELERSVSSFYYLQCVGFKVGAEKDLGIELPHQNAVSFLYNHPGCTEVSKDQAQYGDNAIWGPQDGCPAATPQEANNLCSSNSACCGHIGVITKTVGNQKIYVTSANASGNGSVDTREFTRYNVDKVIRCQ